MSKIANKPICWPDKLSVSYADSRFTFKLGDVIADCKIHASIDVKMSDFHCNLALKEGYVDKSHLGTSAASLKNCVADMLDLFKVRISLVGVGFKAFCAENCIILSIGYSHFIAVLIPHGISVSIKDSKIELAGFCHSVTSFAAKLKSFRRYDPYKGKGIIIDGQYLRRKSGKKKS